MLMNQSHQTNEVLYRIIGADHTFSARSDFLDNLTQSDRLDVKMRGKWISAEEQRMAYGRSAVTSE